MKRHHFFMFFCLVIFSFTNEKALAQCPVTITPSPATVCIGSAVTLTASGATSYTWGPGGFITPAVSVAPTVNTIYTVTATSGTCTATQTVIVNVLALPVISATSDDICIGGTGTLTASNAVSYTWSTGYVGNPLVQSPVTSTCYTVNGTSPQGCVGTTTACITVHPLPPVTVNSATICIGSCASLTANGASNYSWSNGGIGATIAPCPTVSPTDYTVTGTSAFGCVNTATASVTVNPLPTVTVNSATVCANTTATLTASGASTYSWNTGATTSSITPSPSSTTNYTVTGTSPLGCKDFTTTVVSTLTSPTVVATSTVICPASCATLTASGATSYTWSANAGSATTNTMSACPTSTSQFSVTGENASGCKDSTTALITVYLNTVDITPPVGTNTLYCTNVAYQFGSVDSTSGGFGVQFYQWYVTPSSSVTMTNGACTLCNGPTITFDTTGIYTLTVVVNLTSGCLDSAKYTLSVIQTPTITTSPFAAFVCQGGPDGTMLHVTGAGNNGTYNWSPTINIATQYAAGDSVLINPPNLGIYNYTVVGTNSDGCPSAPSVITATVQAPPVISAYSGSVQSLVTDSICSLISTTINMIPSYIITGSTYTWTAAPTANIGTPFSNTSAVTPQYTGNVDTTYVYYGNLTVPGCPAYPTYTVYVVIVPSPTVHVVSDTVENCNKKGDSLFVNSNPPTGVNYNWTPNYNISTTVGNAVFVHPNFPETYYVTPNIHVGTHICYGKPDSVKVLIGDTMVAAIHMQYDIICKTTRDTLIANPPRTPLNSTYQYYWSIPAVAAGATTTVTGDTLVISPYATGVYTLTVKGTCMRQNTTKEFVYVNTCNPPVAHFTETADTICRRKCVTYTDQSISDYGTQKPLWYRWTFTVQPPQISIFCIGAPCSIRHDTVLFQTTDSSNIPKIKVCYYQNSALNGAFPITETISHDPNFAVPTWTASATSAVTVYDGPLALATKTQTINLGDAVTISGLQSSGTLATLASYSWYPASSLSCTNCPTPVANPSVTTQYVLTVTDHNGCTDTSNITIFVDQICFDPFVPSGFSPNGDQLNDILYVRSNCLKNFTFMVFDRWGEKVFETDDLTKGWDGSFRGSPMNAGVFMYTLEGYQTGGGKEIRQKGNITLVK